MLRFARFFVRSGEGNPRGAGDGALFRFFSCLYNVKITQTVVPRHCSYLERADKPALGLSQRRYPFPEKAVDEW